jgi:two-component system response regulator LytT
MEVWMLKALVVDDEAPARSELRYLLGEAGGVEVVGEAGNAVEALQLIKAIPYDVIFLDIHMPGLTGVQLAEVLAGLSRPPSIIFVTAHSEHAVKAFEVRATDYLVKPVEIDRLRQAIARLEPAAEQAPALVERIPVEKAGKKLLINVADILYVMAKDDYSYLYTPADRYLSTISLAQLEIKLEPVGFFRIHRRYLVNLARVKEVVPMYGGTLLLTLADDAATQIPVSRRRVPALKKALGL